MDKSELRVGNYILMPDWHTKIPVIRRVDAIGIYGVITSKKDPVTGSDLSEQNDSCSGIEITLSNGSKCGFHDGHTEINGHTLVLVNGKFYLQSQYIGLDYKLVVKYVHQLQNLFFALTQSELNVNL